MEWILLVIAVVVGFAVGFGAGHFIGRIIERNRPLTQLEVESMAYPTCRCPDTSQCDIWCISKEMNKRHI